MPRPLRRIAAVVVLTLVAVAFALPATAGGDRTTRRSPAPPSARTPAIRTRRARPVTVNPGTREVCWSVHVENVDLPLVAAHIHSGSRRSPDRL